MRRFNALPRSALLLSLPLLVLLPLAAAVGLFVPEFYRDAPWSVPQLRGQDLITLAVVEPLLLVGVIAAAWGRLLGHLLWIGAVGYVLYTYATYSYGVYFNALFLVYLALFSAALFALISLLSHLDVARLRAAIRPTMPARLIAAFLAVFGLFFLVAWPAQIIPPLLRGEVPEPIRLAATPSSAIYVQDLGLVMPLFFLAAVWLWQRRAWDFALGAIMLLLADLMLLALVGMGIFSAQAGIPGTMELLWLWVVLGLASMSMTALFVVHLGRPAPDVAAMTTGPEAIREGADRETQRQAAHATPA